MSKIITIVPTLNEGGSIESVVRECKKYGDVLVVDGGSTDRTVELATRAGARVILEKRRGYGAAYQAGFREINGKDIVAMVDGDGTYPLDRLPLLINRLIEDGYDMVLADRLNGDMESGSMSWLSRFGNNRLTNMLNRLYGTSIHDSLTGFRVIRALALDKMVLTQRGMPFASEMIIEAVKNNLKVGEVACGYRKRVGSSKLSPLRDGFRVFKVIFWLLRDSNPLLFFSILGLISILIGAGFGTVTAIENYTSGGKVFHTGLAILSALGILGGLQLIIIGVVLDSIKQMVERLKKQVKR